MDGIEFGPEVLEAREEFIAHRLREFDVLVSNISTCEVINVLGVNKDKLEEIRDVHRRTTLLDTMNKTGTQEDEDKWTEIGLGNHRGRLTTPGDGGNWIVSVLIGASGNYGMRYTLP